MKLPALLDGRGGRLARAGLSGVAGRLATLLAPLVATPAMLHHLGDADFGLWATGVSITSIAVVADLGIANGLLTRVATAYGRSDFAEIRKYLSGAYVALTVVACLLLGMALLGFWLLHGSSIILAVLTVFFMGMPGTVFYQFLYGIQRVPFGNAVVVSGAAAAVAACLAAIYLNAPGWMVVVAYALPSALMPYAGAIWFFGVHRQFRPSLMQIDSHSLHDLMKLGSGFFLLSIITGVGMNVDNIIISATAGSEAVAAFSIPVRLGSILGLLTMALFMPLWGANGEALARQDYAWVERTARRMSLLGLGLTVAGGALLVVCSDFLIELWVGRRFDNQTLVLVAVVFSFGVVAATSPYNMVLNALGRVQVQIWPWLVFLIISVAAKLILVTPQTVWQVPLVTGVVYALIVCPVMIWSAHRALANLRG